uniref:hypothetical protein n=1 Tax=Jatropha curcas TaxID=180498 RepID=UPI0027A1B0BE|nr:hypothetical protein QLP06_mgp009 [Jatropha curcas]WFG81230.1 hypothetical protein [Jatropha curcas]
MLGEPFLKKDLTTPVRGLGLIPLSYIILLNLQSNQSTCLLAYRHSFPLGQSCLPLLRLEMRSHLLVQEKVERNPLSPLTLALPRLRCEALLFCSFLSPHLHVLSMLISPLARNRNQLIIIHLVATPPAKQELPSFLFPYSKQAFHSLSLLHFLVGILKLALELPRSLKYVNY